MVKHAHACTIALVYCGSSLSTGRDPYPPALMPPPSVMRVQNPKADQDGAVHTAMENVFVPPPSHPLKQGQVTYLMGFSKFLTITCLRRANHH